MWFQVSDASMMQKNEKMIPNPFPIPDLSSEGRWYNGLSPVTDEKVNPRRRGWHRNLEPYRRLFSHQTLSSARKNCFFEPCDKVIFYSLKRCIKPNPKPPWLVKSNRYRKIFWICPWRRFTSMTRIRGCLSRTATSSRRLWTRKHGESCETKSRFVRCVIIINYMQRLRDIRLSAGKCSLDKTRRCSI